MTDFDHGLAVVGEAVRSRTPAGVQVTTKPTNGEYRRRREVTGVFKEGVVLDAHGIVIDYDTWPNSGGIGRVKYRCCLVRDSSGVVGWAGEGALIFVNDDMDRGAWVLPVDSVKDSGCEK